MKTADIMNIGSIVVLVAVFYFMLIRPQQKQAKEKRTLLENLEVKDQVVTIGGLYGTIMRVKEDSVILKIADKTEVEFLKSAIGSKRK